MRSKAVGLTWVLIFSLLQSGAAVRATPTPPYTLVNHSTQQCYETILGDDCMWCDPPPGWEVLGPSYTTQCPAGYARLERLALNCVPYKNQFCCTGGSHGPGDCEDLIVNASQELCAFVADIVGCTVPEGWAKQPADGRESGWVCPYGYQWAADVACLVETATAEPSAPTEPTRTDALPRSVYWLVAAIGGIFLATLAWVSVRRGRRRSGRNA
jgi:hypothetical protein